MEASAYIVQIFAASPGDTAEERIVLAEIVAEINRDNGRSENYQIDLKIWEEDSRSDVGGAQEVITRQIGDYDIFLGFMSTRFGSPTKRWGSGTQEEFYNAFEKYQYDPNSIRIIYFFRDPTIKLSKIDLGQAMMVNRFRNELKDLGIFIREYETVEGKGGFRELVRRHIVSAVNELLNPKSNITRSHTQRANETSKQLVTELKEDWTAKTQHIFPQWASYRGVFDLPYSYSYFSLTGIFQSDSPYFRFGFKLLTKEGRTFGDTTIQSTTGGDNLVLHIGKNTDRDEMLFAYYEGGRRRESDIHFINYKEPREIPIEINVNQDDVCKLIVDNVKLYEKQISRDMKKRLLLVAWGDQHDYEVHFRKIRLEFA